jgi:purine nucleosidase
MPALMHFGRSPLTARRTRYVIARIQLSFSRFHLAKGGGMITPHIGARTMKRTTAFLCLLFSFVLTTTAVSAAQTRRKVIIDQDGRGPATTDQQSMLLILQSPAIETLGITIVSGDQWRDEEVAHTLRMLELTRHTDIKVYPGAVFPLINSKEEIKRWEKLYGVVSYQGAWNEHKIQAPTGSTHTGAWNSGVYRGPFEVPNPLPEGNPTLKAETEDAAHFLIRMVHQYPHEVTIYAAGPLTNIAQAISLDPKFPELAQELVVMGGSISPVLPANWGVPSRREFNFWWDPEAVHITLRAPWKRITVTTVDISVKTHMTRAMIDEIAKAGTPAARYIGKWADEEFLWDELTAAAWIDPTIITKEEQLAMDIDISHAAGYGNTLVWTPDQRPGLGEQIVHVQTDLNLDRFNRMVIDLLSRPPN